MDGTAITLGVLSMTATLGAAGISTLANVNARHARKVGNSNAEKLERLEMQTDRRQTRLIKKAAEDVARKHPELLASAVADELVRNVLEAILEGHLEHTEIPQRRHPEDLR